MRLLFTSNDNVLNEDAINTAFNAWNTINNISCDYNGQEWNFADVHVIIVMHQIVLH